MKILQSLVGYEVRVFIKSEGDDEEYFEGQLKEVDSNGILILMKHDSMLNYFKHTSYIHVTVVENQQSKSSVFEAFRQTQDEKFKWHNK